MNDRFDLAIWLESDELPPTDQSDDSGDSRASDTSGIQVHLNFWKLPKYKSLDIGINFPTITKGKICLFINTQESLHVADISKSFETSDIRNVVFNEFMTVNGCPEECMCWKTKQRSNPESVPFCICGIEKTIKTTEKYGGKLVHIELSNPGCKKYNCECHQEYIRLRLTGEAINSLYNQEQIPSSKLEYYTSKIEFLDFRLNNVRSLPTSFLQDIKSFPILNKVRCFLMLEASEELFLYNKSYKKVRAIEKDRWGSYLSELAPYKNDSQKAILAYQWNSDQDTPDFSLFTEIKVNSFSWKTFLLYLFFFVFIGLIPSLIASWLYAKLW